MESMKNINLILIILLTSCSTPSTVKKPAISIKTLLTKAVSSESSLSFTNSIKIKMGTTHLINLRFFYNTNNIEYWLATNWTIQCSTNLKDWSTYQDHIETSVITIPATNNFMFFRVKAQ